MARDGEAAIAMVEAEVEATLTVIGQLPPFAAAPHREILHQPANVSIFSTDVRSWGRTTDDIMLQEDPQFEQIALVHLFDWLGRITNIPGPPAADVIKAF